MATRAQGTKGGAQVSLLNIITELKKCCNHPFLFSSAEADFRDSGDSAQAVDRLVVTSGKMVLLDKLMRRLKETGHRCRPGLDASVSPALAVMCPARWSSWTSSCAASRIRGTDQGRNGPSWGLDKTSTALSFCTSCAVQQRGP